jgi:hypothetical protein
VRGKRTLLAVCAAAAALVPAAPAAAPRPQTDVSFRYDLTTKRPGAPSGAHVLTVYRRRGGGQPQAARRAEIFYPKGSSFDHTRLPMCRASDDELTSKGEDACPHDTLLGRGEVELVTPYSSEPVQFDETTINAPHTLILLITYPGTGQTAAVRREHDHGRRHWTDSPPACVPPGEPPSCPLGEVTVGRFEVWDPPPGYRVTKSTLHLPRRCPKSRRWTFRVRLTFGDGSRVVRTSRPPCRPRKRPAGAAR